MRESNSYIGARNTRKDTMFPAEIKEERAGTQLVSDIVQYECFHMYMQKRTCPIRKFVDKVIKKSMLQLNARTFWVKTVLI
jgi:hypothetical protein